MNPTSISVSSDRAGPIIHDWRVATWKAVALVALGGLLVIAGIAFWSRPAALIVAGVGLLAAGLMIDVEEG